MLQRRIQQTIGAYDNALVLGGFQSCKLVTRQELKHNRIHQRFSGFRKIRPMRHAMSKNLPRKVILITADQRRGECLGCLDHPVVQTPTLDRLAAEGVLFQNHYCQTVPCGPSRASLLTGMYMMNHRCVNNGTPLDRHFTNSPWKPEKEGASRPFSVTPIQPWTQEDYIQMILT